MNRIERKLNAAIGPVADHPLFERWWRTVALMGWVLGWYLMCTLLTSCTPCPQWTPAQACQVIKWANPCHPEIPCRWNELSPLICDPDAVYECAFAIAQTAEGDCPSPTLPASCDSACRPGTP